MLSIASTGNYRKTGFYILAACIGTFLLNSGVVVSKTLSESIPGEQIPGAEKPATTQLQKLIAGLREGDSYEKQRAAISLGNLGDAQAVEPLIAALKDKDEFVRNFAARSLGDLGDPRAVDSLIQAMGDPNVLVRRSAAEALGNLGDSRAVDPLLGKIKNEDAIVRRAAIEALGRIGDLRAVDPIIELLGEKDFFIRNAAADALVGFGKPALPKMVDALHDWIIGPRILEILKELQWQPATDEEKVWFYVARRDRQSLSDDWATAGKVLLSGLKSGEEARMRSSVCALIGIGNNDVVDTLINFLKENNSVETAEIFLKCGNPALMQAGSDWISRNKIEVDPADVSPVVEWGKMVSH